MIGVGFLFLVGRAAKDVGRGSACARHLLGGVGLRAVLDVAFSVGAKGARLGFQGFLAATGARRVALKSRSKKGPEPPQSRARQKNYFVLLEPV